MRKRIPIILSAISYLILIAAVLFCICSIIDSIRITSELTVDPGASGMDYFGIGWGYGIGLFTLSVFGLIFAGISMHGLRQKFLRWVTGIAILIFVLLLITSIFLFYM